MATQQIKNTTRKFKVSDLLIHPTAQRRIVLATFRKIVAHPNLDAIGTIHAVEYPIGGRSGPWVVDGQTRIAALLKLGKGSMLVSVQTHHDVQDEAAASRLFVDLNRRAAVATYDLFINELQYGEETAVGAANVVSKHKLRVVRSGGGDGTIQCVNTIKALYRKDDGRALDLALDTALAAWGRTEVAVEGKILEGLGNVYATYNGRVDRDALVKKMAKVPGGALGLLSNAKALRSLRNVSLAKCVTDAAVEIYNKGRKVGVLGEAA